MSRLLWSALFLGVVMGVFGIAGGYLVMTFLPQGFGPVIPIVALAIPIAVMWPHWFDRGPDGGWLRRLLRRFALVASAAPIGGIVAWLVVTAVPGYLRWNDDMHRHALVRRGVPAAEIESTVAAHRMTSTHALVDGIMLTGMPSTVAALLTTGASAFVWPPSLKLRRAKAASREGTEG